MPADDPEKVVKAVGMRVAELRLEKGLTQAELAEAMGVATQWVSRVENGGANLTIYTLVRLGRTLGAEISELFAKPLNPARKAKRGRPRRGI